MNDDAALLQRYAADGSQEAFAELVRRHLGVVYNAALRQSNGNTHRAEDIAQLVFTDLARKAARLSRHGLLVAWLHTSTRYAAAQVRRTEIRREAREREAHAMNEADFAPDGPADWERLRPILDDALQSLGERDRAAVLLRFFENRSFAELGATFSVSEDAARVRVNRALDKLRSALARRGLASSSSALVLALADPAFAATPPGLAAQITVVSLAAPAGVAGATAGLGLVSFAGTAKIAATLVGAVGLLSIGVAFYSSDSAPKKAAAIPPAISVADRAALPPTPRASARSTLNAAAPGVVWPKRPAPDEVIRLIDAYLALPPLPSDAAPALVNPRAAELRGLVSLFSTHRGLFERLLDGLAVRTGEAENHLRGLAFEVWTEREAPVAARWAADLVPTDALNADTRRGYLRQAALAWSSQDFDAAYAWAGALPEPELVDNLANALIVSLAGTDGPRALTLAQARGHEFFAKAEQRLVLGWGRTDPAAVLHALGTTALAERRFNYPYQEALGGWFRKKPAAALDWLFAQPPPDTSIAKFTFESLITNGEVLNLPDPGVVANALLGRPEQAQYLPPLVKNWATRYPEAALAWLDTLSDASLRAELIEYASSQVAIQTGRSYLAFVLRLPPGDDRDAKITQLLSNWAKIDPDAVLGWLHAHDTLEFAGVNTRMTGQLIGELAATDPAGALARWKELPAGAAKTAVAAGVATGWAKTDPAAATRWYAEGLPAIPKDKRMLLSVMSSMLHVMTPGSTGQARIAGSEELSVPYYTFAYTVGTWAQKEPLPALHWAETLPDASQRQLAFAAISTAGSAPFRAQADLLAQIQDPAQRSGAVSEALGYWIQKDPASARAWLDSNTVLSPEQAAKIIQNANPSRR